MPFWIIKYVIPALLVASLIFGVIAWRKNDIQHWKDAGRAELTEEIRIAKEKADAATRERQSNIRKESSKRKAKIHEKNDDRPVGPLLDRYFSELRAAD